MKKALSVIKALKAEVGETDDSAQDNQNDELES